MDGRQRAQIVGIGETRYTKWGGIQDASEHALACEAIVRAVSDANLSMDDVDGLASFAEDRNEAIFVAAELGLDELRFANMVWMPGGGVQTWPTTLRDAGLEDKTASSANPPHTARKEPRQGSAGFLKDLEIPDF